MLVRDELTKEHVDKMAQSAKNQERFWNLAVPERNMTWKSPMFWGLLGLVCYLHHYNGQIDEEAEKAASVKAEVQKVALDICR